MAVIKYIAKFLFLFFSVFVFSQELPPIQNYSIIDYGGTGNQNWSISQSDNKIIYVANNSGLLEFNGAKWRLYPSPNGSDIRSVKVIDNLIYTGCYMEFGYWEKNEYGGLIYTSLLEKLKTPLEEDEQFYTYKPDVKDDSTWPFDANQFLILNIAMGGTLGGNIDPGFTESTMEIDYVRVYQ